MPIVWTYLADGINYFLYQNSLISAAQYGFVKGRSTEVQLLHCTNLRVKAIDNKRFVDTVYIDFAKAFDNRLLGRVVKGVWHLDHVWSYDVREVVNSIPDWGNIVGWVFHPDKVTGKVFSSENAFPSKFWIHLEHCPRGEAVIIGHLRLSSMR